MHTAFSNTVACFKTKTTSVPQTSFVFDLMRIQGRLHFFISEGKLSKDRPTGVKRESSQKFAGHDENLPSRFKECELT